MLIELIKNKTTIKVIRLLSGCTILSNCIVCNSPIKGHDNWRALCNSCGESLSPEKRIYWFKLACDYYPQLII
jgi:hypothetical protein